MVHIHTDITIIGGGIAGLWLLNRLRQQGYNTVLLEKKALGCGQTLASQGIIHGGTKYALNGLLTTAAQAISQMPARWQACLQGRGEIDLSATRILSRYHYLWSNNSIGSRLTAFFASKALRDRITLLPHDQWPDVFKHQNCSSPIYRLNEYVIDTPSLIESLTKNNSDRILQADISHAHQWHTHNRQIRHLNFNQNESQITLHAQRFILCAGAGNSQLLNQLDILQPAMQRRPLHMVMVRHSYPHPLFAHRIGTGSKPLVTITSHPLNQQDTDQQVWYIGGNIAETGVNKTKPEQIQCAQQLLLDSLPWVKLTDAVWDTLCIDRAEPLQSDLTRPDIAFTCPVGNAIVAWPTKLALAPDLGDQVLKILDKDRIQPLYAERSEQLQGLLLAKRGSTVWEHSL